MACLVLIENTKDWASNDIKDNIEEEFPGWKVKWVAFVSDFTEKQILAEIVTSPDPH